MGKAETTRAPAAGCDRRYAGKRASRDRACDRGPGCGAGESYIVIQVRRACPPVGFLFRSAVWPRGPALPAVLRCRLVLSGSWARVRFLPWARARVRSVPRSVRFAPRPLPCVLACPVLGPLPLPGPVLLARFVAVALLGSRFRVRVSLACPPVASCVAFVRVAASPGPRLSLLACAALPPLPPSALARACRPPLRRRLLLPAQVPSPLSSSLVGFARLVARTFGPSSQGLAPHGGVWPVAGVPRARLAASLVARGRAWCRAAVSAGRSTPGCDSARVTRGFAFARLSCSHSSKKTRWLGPSGMTGSSNPRSKCCATTG